LGGWIKEKERKVIDVDLGGDYDTVLAKEKAAGWRLVEAAPIEKISVKIIGRRFKFERECAQSEQEGKA